MENMSTKNLTLIPLFTALTSIGAFIKFPIPFTPIPLTLQVAFVVLSGILLGSKHGALSQLLYMTLGLIGLPIFAQGGGISYLANPSFGFIIGFIFASFIAGYIVERTQKNKITTYIFASFLSVLVIYIIGILYLFLIMNYYLMIEIDLYHAFILGAASFIIKDILLILLVSSLTYKINMQLKNSRLYK